jgi:hypothetical protein
MARLSALALASAESAELALTRDARPSIAAALRALGEERGPRAAITEILRRLAAEHPGRAALAENPQRTRQDRPPTVRASAAESAARTAAGRSERTARRPAVPGADWHAW